MAEKQKSNWNLELLTDAEMLRFTILIQTHALRTSNCRSSMTQRYMPPFAIMIPTPRRANEGDRAAFFVICEILVYC
jgi:hypothetical protein